MDLASIENRDNMGSRDFRHIPIDASKTVLSLSAAATSETETPGEVKALPNRSRGNRYLEEA